MTTRLISVLCGAAIVITGTSIMSSAKTGDPKGRPYTPEAVYAPAGIHDLFLTKGRDETEYNVTWRGGAESGQSVRWARADALTADGELPADSAFCPASTEKGISRARISGLEPSFSYAYQVGSDYAGWSDVNVFRAGGAPDGRFSFIAAGDPQLGASTVDIDTRSWEVTLGKVSEWFGRESEFLLCLGDQVNNYDKEEQYAAFGTPDYMRSTPILTVPGNHDNDKTYSDHFTYTDVDQASVSRSGQYGGDYWVAHDGCLFLNINCVDNSGAVHDAFIGRAIEEYTALYGEPAWKFVSMHYSAYSGAADEWNTGRREKYSPIFSKYGIDVVLSGHDHVYARSYVIDTLDPIDDPDLYVPVGDDPFGSYEDPTVEQTFYLTANTSTGGIFYELELEVELPWVASKSQEYVPTVTKVDVEPDMLVFTTYRVGPDNDIGDVVDFFAIHRTAGVEDDLYAPVITVPREQYYDPDLGPVDLMKGVAAYDNFDRDVTASVTCEGRLDPSTASVITYTVTDAAGNTATAERRMIPEKRSVPVGTADGAGDPEWAYLDGGEVPFDCEEEFIYWTLPGFDDSAWKRGSGSFGAIEHEPFAFGINADVTPDTLLDIYFPDDSDDAGFACPNFFFRCEFDLDDPQNVASIIGDLQLNDAIEVYINGVNVMNANVPGSVRHFGYSGNYNTDGRLTRSVFTINDADFIASLGLKKSGNVLAVELYEGTGHTDDVFFNMKSLSFIVRGGEVENPFTNPFTDVPESKWYTDGVLYCYRNGYMSGTSETTFEPDTSFTRAMFITVLAKIDQSDTSSYTGTSFDDVPAEKWYSAPIEWAYQNGYTSGLGGGKFGPNNAVTREQLAVFFCNYSEKKGNSIMDLADLSEYTDSRNVSPWAVRGMQWAVGNGLISGVKAGDTVYLQPAGSATRAQVALIVKNYVEKFVK